MNKLTLSMVFCLIFCVVSPALSFQQSKPGDIEKSKRMKDPETYLQQVKDILQEKLNQASENLSVSRKLVEKLNRNKASLKEKSSLTENLLRRMRHAYRAAEQEDDSWPVTVQGETLNKSRLKSRVRNLLAAQDHRKKVIDNLNSEIIETKKTIDQILARMSDLETRLSQVETDFIILESGPKKSKVRQIVRRAEKAAKGEGSFNKEPRDSGSSPSAEDFLAMEEDQDPASSLLNSTPKNSHTKSKSSHNSKIDVLLQAARKNLSANKLTKPEDNNALKKYKKVLSLDPKNTMAKQGLVKIVEKYLAFARSALDRGICDKALEYIDRAKKAGVQTNNILNMEQRIKKNCDQKRSNDKEIWASNKSRGRIWHVLMLSTEDLPAGTQLDKSPNLPSIFEFMHDNPGFLHKKDNQSYINNEIISIFGKMKFHFFEPKRIYLGFFINNNDSFIQNKVHILYGAFEYKNKDVADVVSSFFTDDNTFCHMQYKKFLIEFYVTNANYNRIVYPEKYSKLKKRINKTILNVKSKLQ